MLKHFKKPIVFITILAIVSTLFYGVHVSGAASGWSSSLGSPILNDAGDGYAYFNVNAVAAVCSDEKYNLEEKELYIRNLELPEKTYWGVIAFCADPAGNTNISAPEEGLLALFIVGNNDYPDKYQLFFWDGSVQLELGLMDRVDNITASFINTAAGYVLQVNEKTITHSYVTDFCKKNYHKNTRVNFYAYNWMTGEAKITDRLWEVKADANMPSVYKKNEDTYRVVANDDNGIFCSSKKIAFDSQKIDLNVSALDEGEMFTLGFNLTDKEYSKNNSTFGFTAEGETIKVSIEGSSSKYLGSVAKAPKYSISVSENNGMYSLVVNGTVFDCNVVLSAFGASDKKAYVTAKIPKSFVADVFISHIYWEQFSGNDGAVVKLNADNSNHIEVVSGQNVRAPGKHDLFTTGIKLSNLDIPAANSSGHGAFIYFGKTLVKNAPCVASADALTLLIEKTSGGVSFYLLNSNGGTKSLLGEVAESDEYNISISLVHRSRTLKVNDTHLRLDKFTDAAAVLASQNIEEFLGSGDTAMTYIAFATNNYAKADVDLFVFERPLTPIGFSVYSNGKTYNADGDEKVGFSATETKEAYAVTNTIYAPTVYALSAKLKNVTGPLYFALSTTDITDTNFWVCGDGTTAKRFCFIITPADNNTKAQVAYYGADGVNATETLIDTIDFDWTAKHSYDVRKLDDGSWYLAIDAEPVNKLSSVALDDFMNTNQSEELFYAIGGKKGLSVSGLRLIKQPVTPVVVEQEGWTAYSGQLSQLEKDANGDYVYPTASGSIYNFRNGTENITETSVKIKINSLKPVLNKKFIYFALSATDLSDKNVAPTGTIDDVQRVIFRMSPDFENNKLTINTFNDDAAGGETTVATIDFDYSVEHTFDVRLATDGNWYLCVDNKVVSGVVFELLQDFIEKYGFKALYYGIGSWGVMNAEKLNIVDQAPGDVVINTETWHHVSSIGRGPLEGNDKDGYGIERDCTVFAYSDKTYDITTTALSTSISNVGAWLYFCLSKTDYLDLEWLPHGSGDQVNRVILLIVPLGHQTQFQYWCSDGVSYDPTIITTYEFDWFGKEHTFDVRQSEEDGNWYFCVDGRLLMNRVSQTLNQFMEANEGLKLRYGFGGMNCFGASNLKIIDKPKAIGEDDGSGEFDEGFFEGEQDFGFDFDFDNVEEEEVIDENFNFDFDSEVEDEIQVESEEIQEYDPLDYLQKVKVKKRRLVSAAHGIIFTTFEKISMVAGGIAVIGAVTFLVVIIIKKSKKKKMP